jgi:phytoene dehydrogenase-like protein
MLPDGGELALWRDVTRSASAIRRLSPKDAERWPQFCRRMAALARVFQELYLEPPADPLNLRLALRVRRLGREGMEDLMRVLPMSVAELLDDWFECDALKGALGAMGVLHFQQGPRSGGTAFRLLHHHVGSAEGVFRPVRSNLGTELRRRPGLELRQGRVQSIRMRGGRVDGLVLHDGQEIAAGLIVSGLDPRRTLLELADPGWLDPELARAVARIRRRGIAARLRFDARLKDQLIWAPSLDYLERAYDDSKYGRASSEPYLETASRPEGVEVHFQFAPHELVGRSEALVAAARRLLPALGDASGTVLDVERALGWPGGQAYHAELALDQALWMRPLPELASYRTPLKGLWLCGPGMHPGGGIVGASGYNCARSILKEKGNA